MKYRESNPKGYHKVNSHREYKLDNDGILDVSEQGLTSLDELPKGIKRLYCWNNNLTSLPELPEGILEVSCGDNLIKYLPVLPNSLEYLWYAPNPVQCIIPRRYLIKQHLKWQTENYLPFIASYYGQHSILTRQPEMIGELIYQTENWLRKPYGLLDEINKEFSHLINGCELGLL